jgi:hypothetical protein
MPAPGSSASLLPAPVARMPDLRAIAAVECFAYWNQGGRTARHLVRIKALELLRKHVSAANMHDFVALLIANGLIDDFVGLMQSPIDTGDELRDYVVANGADLDQIRFYASWHGADPNRFAKGFTLGVAESFATVAVDLWHLAELAARMERDLLGTAALAVVDPAAGLAQLTRQVAVVGTFAESLLALLDPAALPAHVADAWADWQREFNQHLDAMDPFAAGRQLGMLGGNLFAILDGVGGLVKLLRVTAKGAVRFTPLLFTSLRAAGPRLLRAFSELAEVLAKIGRGVIDALPVVGVGALRALLGPKLARKLIAEGRALVQHIDLTLVPVLRPSYAQAFGGAPMASRYGVMIAQEGKPVLMVATSDALPAVRIVDDAAGVPHIVPTKAMVDDAQAALAETLDKIDDAFDELARGGPASVAELQASAATFTRVGEHLQERLRKLVQRIAEDAFADIKPTSTKQAGQLGNEVDRRIAAVLPAELAAAAPGVEHAMQLQLRTTIARLGELSPRMVARLEEPVVELIARRTDLLDLIGVGTDRSPAAIAKFVKRRFEWTTTTKVGALKSDLLLFDRRARWMVNVDWSSTTKLEDYIALQRQARGDLGGAFKGDWEGVAAAYAKAGKDVPVPVKNRLQRLAAHAVRETVVRRVALEEVLGETWRVTSHEMTYDGLRTLLAASAK